jgi:hypothetical protein
VLISLGSLPFFLPTVAAEIIPARDQPNRELFMPNHKEDRGQGEGWGGPGRTPPPLDS